MKRLIFLFLVVGVILLAFSVSSFAEELLPVPEDTAGRESSAFLPQKVKGAPAAKGSEKFNLTGPVTIGVEEGELKDEEIISEEEVKPQEEIPQAQTPKIETTKTESPKQEKP